jgi:hypothetical protein
VAGVVLAGAEEAALVGVVPEAVGDRPKNTPCGNGWLMILPVGIQGIKPKMNP